MPSPPWLAARRAPLLVILLAAASGCARAPRVRVQLSGSPDDALVTVDDRYVGKLGRLERTGLRLPVGRHRLTVEQVGYFPHDQILVVRAEGNAPVRVELVPVPD